MAMQYRIMQTDGETGWDKVPEFTLEHILWRSDSGIRAGGRICHDGENLYVILWAKEREIRAENTLPASPVHEDSCLELFLMPDGAEGYLNFEINPNGCLHLGYGTNRRNREDILLPDEQETFRIRTERSAEGWEVKYRIPAGFLRTFYPAFACRGILRANVYKCGDKTPHPHFLAWKPISSPTPDFHRPDCFGEMIFSEADYRNGV